MRADTSPSTPAHFHRQILATLVVAAPIVVAQLGQMAMGVTDMVMLGGISADALAAGGLGANLFFTCLFTLQGVTSGVAVLAARARGAGQNHLVPSAYWSGLLLGALLAIPFFWLMSQPQPLLRAAGEPETLIANIAAYLHVLRWGVPAGLVGIGVLRAFLPAVGLQNLMLWIIPGAIALNAALNVWFIRGGWFLPAYGMQGSAAATAITLWVTALSLAVLLHTGRHRHHVRPTRPTARTITELLAIGLPVGGTVVVEATLFLATALLVGQLGPVALAAHQVAITTASVTFMVPLAISQAANVRVANAAGAGRLTDARRAGFAAMLVAITFMLCSAATMLAAPHTIARLFLLHTSPALPLAATLLRIAGAFQIADGLQVTASGALRGLKDTRIPMLLAAAGYWGIGYWLGRALAFPAGLGAAGLWWGLFAGLAVVAVCLTARFAMLTNRKVTKIRPGALPLHQAGASAPDPNS